MLNRNPSKCQFLEALPHLQKEVHCKINCNVKYISYCESRSQKFGRHGHEQEGGLKLCLGGEWYDQIRSISKDPLLLEGVEDRSIGRSVQPL